MTAMSRESVMKNYLSQVKDRYDYVLIDTEPAKDESFIFSRSQTILQSFYIFMPFTMPVVQKVLHCIRRLPEKTGQFCIVI